MGRRPHRDSHLETLDRRRTGVGYRVGLPDDRRRHRKLQILPVDIIGAGVDRDAAAQKLVLRSEEHTSELQSLMRISYAVFCLKKKKKTIIQTITHTDQKIHDLKTT